ncbi:expansin-like A1 [Malania oleifera]|uniref:expansin-like A1 n=1 Tax=Malania oleifera TaxID=397392 RepID=UPI0025AE3791|nr:expansin-like A1 [Malania oleifera]
MDFFLLGSFLLLVISSATACDRCIHQSNASYFSNSAVLMKGACGYGPLALKLGGRFLAAGVSSLYKNGAGCGGCLQMRCKDKALCRSEGIKVFLFDLNNSNRTDLVLSRTAFSAMARNGKGQDILNEGIVNVEYRKVPCVYRKNLSVRVEEISNKSFLALKFLYQGGQTDIVAVDIAKASDSSRWQYMTRNYGAVWSTDSVPQGPLQLRLVVTGGYDGKWIWAHGPVLPIDWKTGVIYDTGVQINDIAQEGCFPCGDGPWK